MNKLFLILLLSPCLVFASTLPSFSNAKKSSIKIYKNNAKTFYCGCDYELKQKPGKSTKRLTPNLSSCLYVPRKNQKRASRVEWEHVMPAYQFGHLRQCWQKGGRRLCKRDPVFKAMESDLHNLVPAIGEVNGDRSNYKFGMIENEKRAYGACDIEIDFKVKRAEPKPVVRGDIARIYFYMRDRYNLHLSKQQEKIFKAWDKLDPVDDWERTKNKQVKKLQGNSNPYIK